MIDLAIICDEIIESYKYQEETNFNGKKAICKLQNFYIFLSFLSTTRALLQLLVFTVI